MRPLLSCPPFGPSFGRVALALVLGAAPALASITVHLSPPSAVIAPGHRVSFTAKVLGTGNQACTWQVLDGDQQVDHVIDGKGTFMAPDSTLSKLYRVRATSVADGKAFQEVTVLVLPVEPGQTGVLKTIQQSGWAGPLKATPHQGLPFLDMDTFTCYAPQAVVKEIPPATEWEPQVAAYGLPVPLRWDAKLAQADGLMLSLREGGDLLRFNVTGKAVEMIQVTGAVTDCTLQVLRKVPAPPDSKGPAWTRSVERPLLQVRGLVPWAGRMEYGAPWDRGDADGKGMAARFRAPAGMARLGGPESTAFLVADEEGHVLRTVTGGGSVWTTFGRPGQAGLKDGIQGEVRFRRPTFITPWGAPADAKDSKEGPPPSELLVADTGNHVIRLVAQPAKVGTFAGTGHPGFRDAQDPHQAQFNEPRGIATDANRNIYVADAGNHRIRRIDPAGHVTTLAGSGVRGSDDGRGAAATFTDLKGLIIGPPEQTLYAVDGHAIRRISLEGVVTTVVGEVDKAGFLSETLTSRALHPASLNAPWGLAALEDGFLISDTGNHAVRRCHLMGEDREQAFYLTTVAGDPSLDRTRWGLLRDGLPGPLAAEYCALCSPRGILPGGPLGAFVSTDTGIALLGSFNTPEPHHMNFILEFMATADSPQAVAGQPFNLFLATPTEDPLGHGIGFRWTLDLLNSQTGQPLAERQKGRHFAMNGGLPLEATVAHPGKVKARIRIVTDEGVSVQKEFTFTVVPAGGPA